MIDRIEIRLRCLEAAARCMQGNLTTAAYGENVIALAKLFERWVMKEYLRDGE